MEEKQLNELVAKYNEGVADPAEVRLIEQLIEQGKLDLLQLNELSALDAQLVNLPEESPSLALDDRFYSMLDMEKKKVQQSAFSFSLPEWKMVWPRLAVAATLLMAGFLGGYWLKSPSQSSEVQALTQQVTDLKEMMMLTLLQKESATDRLKAVSLTSEMPASTKITDALFETLNRDENVNVRLAALEALTPYVRESHVRENLIRSIAKQDSPLLQVAMAELMVSIQEKKSVKELQKLLQNERTPQEVKSKIKESINVLI